MFSAAFVCLSVCLFGCQHDNVRTSKRRMMKLGGYMHCTKISAEFELGGHSSRGCAPPKMWRWATTLGKSAQAVQFSTENASKTVCRPSCAATGLELTAFSRSPNWIGEGLLERMEGKRRGMSSGWRAEKVQRWEGRGGVARGERKGREDTRWPIGGQCRSWCNRVVFWLSREEASRCIKDGLESLQVSSTDQVENVVAVVQPACDKKIKVFI